MMTVTQLHVHCSQGIFVPILRVSYHEEADTVIMILYAAELGASGITIHLMTQNTYLLVFDL